MALSRVTEKGASWFLTAMPADDGSDGRVVGGVGRVECLTESVDGLALEAEPNVGVDAGGDADVGVAEDFLDDDEVDDALFQEQVAVEWRRRGSGSSGVRSCGGGDGSGG